MAQQIEKLARFVAETTLEQVPEEVQRYAKLVVLDTIGVILAGTDRPEVRALRERLIATAGTGATVLAPDWPASDPRTAALLNGIAGRSLELGEGHRYVSYQGAMQILPGVLSVGEWARSNGRDMLAALILGYDAGARLGTAMKTRPLAHQNGQAALLGAAAAGSRLRALNAADTSRAMRIAATLVLTPSYNNAVAGATALNVAGGMSGFALALAPDLALAGFSAQDDAIEEALSSLVGEGFDPTRLLDELGTRWEITRNWFRLRACCNPIYAALDALEEAITALGAKPQEIERIDVATFRFASVMRHADPPNYFASKYSLPHVAACLAVRGSAGFESVDDSALHDPAITALRHRVHISEDPAMTAAVPALKPARVTLTLKNGRQTTVACDSPRGDCLNPYDESEIREKFRALAGAALTSQGLDEVERAITRLEQWTSASELTDLLRRHCRPDWSRAAPLRS
ncbi:MAG TPA: MmgE/PrpD family protein [Burkholderiales bacterium]|jgi:2-methylcitrate dehydratase PrpD|nr:MmgE/PrpD family protein [Burkholderiales bacterium]